MVSSGTAMNSENNVCRNPPGTKSEDFYKWPAQKFEEMDSTLAVQQYIQQTVREDFKDIEKILDMPAGQDEGVWKYEHLRCLYTLKNDSNAIHSKCHPPASIRRSNQFLTDLQVTRRQFCLELNGLAVRLQSECTADTCSQMTATEQWIFLCAAHKTPKECPAIDYTRHTLDGAACLLNSNKYFPSRVSIKDSSVTKLGSVCRRVYRIFSHAYYHHRQIFDEAENESYLCRRFTAFVIKYNLMSRDNLIVPISELSDAGNPADSKYNPNVLIAKKSPDPVLAIASFLNLPEGVGPDDDDEDESKYDDNFLGLDDSAALDDDFSFADEATFGTLKPSKDAVQPSKEEGSGDPADSYGKSELNASAVNAGMEVGKVTAESEVKETE